MYRQIVLVLVLTATTALADAQKDYIQKAIPYAKEVQAKYGIPPSATIGMSAYESNFGRSKLSERAKNYFGIKDLKRNGPRYYMVTKDYNKTVTHVQPFKRYNSMRESFQGYGAFLQTKRYSKARGVLDGKKFVRIVAQAGYCPDYTYTRNVSRIIDRFNLTQYDKCNKSQHASSNIGAKYRGME